MNGPYSQWADQTPRVPPPPSGCENEHFPLSLSLSLRGSLPPYFCRIDVCNMQPPNVPKPKWFFYMGSSVVKLHPDSDRLKLWAELVAFLQFCSFKTSQMLSNWSTNLAITKGSLFFYQLIKITCMFELQFETSLGYYNRRREASVRHPISEGRLCAFLISTQAIGPSPFRRRHQRSKPSGGERPCLLNACLLALPSTHAWWARAAFRLENHRTCSQYPSSSALLLALNIPENWKAVCISLCTHFNQQMRHSTVFHFGLHLQLIF